MAENKNYKLINTRKGRNSFHLYYFGDKCLYTKSGRNGETIDYKCSGKDDISSEKCPVRGKIEKEVFIFTQRNAHNHKNHQLKSEAEQVCEEMKNDVSKSSETVENFFRNRTSQ